MTTSHSDAVERHEPLTVVLPDSGVEVDVSTPQGAVQALHSLSELESRLRFVKQLCRDALVEESDRRGELSFSVDGHKVTVGGEPVMDVDYDTRALEAGLFNIGCPPEKIDQLLIRKVAVDRRVAKQLARNPKYREILESCVVGSKVGRRRVTVT